MSRFNPSVAVVGHWFRRRRATGIGIVLSGGAVVGIVFPILLQHLIPVIVFGWAVRVIGFMIMVCFIVALGGGPNHHRTGFYYWENPGPFVELYQPGSLGKFLGVWASVVQATFAYLGTELVGVAFAGLASSASLPGLQGFL